MNETERLRLYTSVVPNERQLRVQDMKFYAFVHYTVNTFTNLEWGDGTEDEAVFNPTRQDTDQWCSAIADAEMKGVILTCKHHDGFCLWDTKTTSHNVMNSPYGKDVVRELSESCKKYGLRFGVYLSPWDRNSKYYATEKYNDFYIAQLTELLTNYGEIYMLWLDGACGDVDENGVPPQKYDFERIWSTALRLQPNICLSDCAPDIRWVGNESGISRESEWNVVPLHDYSTQSIEDSSEKKSGNTGIAAQTTLDYENFQQRCIDVCLRDMGSREFLANYNDFVWYPAEVDVSIRKGWFHHGKKDTTTKSIERLMNIYYKAVGGNSLLLLNIPPDTRGLFDELDVIRLREMGYWIRKENELVIEDAKSTAPVKTDRGYEFEISFGKASVDRVRLEEDTLKSQRIENFDIYSVSDSGAETLLYSGTVVGFGKIAVFEPVETEKLRVVITKCRLEPYIKKAEVVETGAYRLTEDSKK